MCPEVQRWKELESELSECLFFPFDDRKNKHKDYLIVQTIFESI